MRHVKNLIFVVAIAVAIPGWIWSQATRSQILGTVTDETGALVPGVTVTLVNEETGIQDTKITGDTGGYVFLYLNPGSYALTFELVGFEKRLFGGIGVQMLEKRRVDAQLKVGQLATQVEVSGAPPQLDMDSATLGTIVSEREVTDLPLNGRDFGQLAVLMPGVQRVGTTGAVGVTAGASFGTQLRVGGGHEWKANNYSYDGVDNTWTYISGPAINPSIDSIQEFRIDRSQFSAESGRGSNQIQLVTKGGTNDFHGTLWEYHRNAALNAGHYYTHVQDGIKRNQYGANIGGPIIRDKAHFFFNWEGQRLRSSTQRQGTVFTPKMRQGDLSEFSQQIVDPFTGEPFPGNIIPAERIDPVSKSLMEAYMPLPNLPGIVANHINVFREVNDWDQFLGRVDFQISENDSFVGRFVGQEPSALTPGLTSHSEATDVFASNYATSVAWTRNWTSSTFSELRHGFHSETILQQSVPRDSYADPNIEGVGDNVPIVTINPFFTHFIAWNFPADFEMTSHDWIANLTHVRGDHIIKAGFETRTHGWARPTGPGPEHVNQNFNGLYSGVGVGDYLLGIPLSASTNNIFIPTSSTPRWTNFYVQDDWSVTPSLTLNLGLRWDLNHRRFEDRDLMTSFDPETGKVVVAGSGIQTQFTNPQLLEGNSDLFITAAEKGWPERTLSFGNHANFSPRFGFAWRPRSRTVIRGGYGMFYLPYWETVQNLSGQTGGIAGTPYGSGGGSVANTRPIPTLNIRNPFAAGLGAVPLPNAVFWDPYMKDGYSQQFNLGVQHSLPWDMVAEATYNGSHTIRLESDINLNQPPATTGAPHPLPYPRYQTRLRGAVNDGHSRYDALELILRKNAEHYSFHFSHVWSKNLSRLSPPDPYNPDAYYGPLRYVPVETKLSWVLDLPVGRGRRYMNRGGIANAILGGWSTTGIWIHQGGSLLTPTAGGNPANVPILPAAFLGDFTAVRPDRTCSGKASNPTVDKWFDTSCFGPPSSGTFGNAGTGIIQGPGSWGLDLGVHKTFHIAEGVGLQVRSEFFNAFNHPNLSAPGAFFGTPTFGVITTRSHSPRVIQFAMRLSF